MTPVKPINGAFPFMRISNKYGIPYADVLMLAEAALVYEHLVSVPRDCVIRGVNIRELQSAVANSFHSSYTMGEFFDALHDATDNFRAIRRNGWDQS